MTPTVDPPALRSIVLTLFAAVLVTAIAGGVWSVLLAANLATSPAFAWSAPAMLAILLLGWSYGTGRWGGSPTARAARRRGLRSNAVPGRAFALALGAGLLAIVALAGAWIVLGQLTDAASRTLPDERAFPPATVALVILTAAIVGAVTEEAMFRGYAQGLLERAVRVPVAIAVVCLVMAPEHALTQGFMAATIVFYLVVDAMLGGIAALTDSIRPGIVVHATGLLAFFAVIWPGDAGRLPASEGGADATFWLHVAQAIVFGGASLFAFGRLARLQRSGGQHVEQPS